MAKVNFTRIDLAKLLSKKEGFSLSYSKELIDKLVDVLVSCISENKLTLKNIGSFYIIKKKSRLGRNPKTKKKFIIEARNSIIFKPSQNLQKKLNN